MATDITTRSALQRARARASIATTLTLSEVMNSVKLGCCCWWLFSGTELNSASLEETRRRGRDRREEEAEPLTLFGHSILFFLWGPQQVKLGLLLGECNLRCFCGNASGFAAVAPPKMTAEDINMAAETGLVVTVDAFFF